MSDLLATMARMTLDHFPVLYNEVMEALNPQPGDCFIDGTLGSGGHSRGILEATAPGGRVFGFDRDRQAIERARSYLMQYGKRLTTIHDSYHNMKLYQRRYETCGPIKGILLDLGYSSPQIDDASRGLSFRADGPLDMRFDQSQEHTAADIVNHTDEAELADLIYQYGEERYSRRIARAIVQARPLSRTSELVEVIRKAAPKQKKGRIDPATRTFQALRIATNDELSIVEAGLPEALDLLAPDGRLAVISFHSLEDRIVKHFMKREASDFVHDPRHPMGGVERDPTLRILTRKPITATEAEIADNPRSRSAKLRIAEKL